MFDTTAAPEEILTAIRLIGQFGRGPEKLKARARHWAERFARSGRMGSIDEVDQTISALLVLAYANSTCEIVPGAGIGSPSVLLPEDQGGLWAALCVIEMILAAVPEPTARLHLQQSCAERHAALRAQIAQMIETREGRAIH